MDVLNLMSTFTSKLFGDDESSKTGLHHRIRRSGSYLTLNKLIGYAIPFAGRAGFEVTELRHGYLRAKMPLKGNTNHLNTMYAGALFTLAEIPGGVMAIFEFGSNYFPVLKEMSVRYLAPATTDTTVVFEISPEQLDKMKREADESGKSEFTLYGRLYDADDNEVAISTGLYQLRKRKSKRN